MAKVFDSKLDIIMYWKQRYTTICTRGLNISYNIITNTKQDQ